MKCVFVRPKVVTTTEEYGHEHLLVFKFLKGDLTRAKFLEHTKPPPVLINHYAQ